MRLEIRSARTTLNPTRQEVMPRRAARFFRFSLSLSPSLCLSPSLSSLRPLPYLLTFLPTFYLPTTHTLFVNVFVCNHVLLEDSAACAGMFGFLLLSFSILNQRHPPPLPIDISCIIFFLRPIPHSCHLPNFPTLFSRTNCFFAFFLILFFIYIFFNLCCLSNNAYC